MKLLIFLTPLRVKICSVELIGALFQSLHLLSPPGGRFVRSSNESGWSTAKLHAF